MFKKIYEQEILSIIYSSSNFISNNMNDFDSSFGFGKHTPQSSFYSPVIGLSESSAVKIKS